MPDYSVSDELLLQATGKGDLKAFEKIVERHHAWVWRIACRFLGHEEEAADVAQEAFIRLMVASNRYQPTAAFKTYFYQIVTRLCLDHSKKKKPLVLEKIPDIPDCRLSAPDALIVHEKNIAVRAAVNALPANQRMAIVLRYFEDLNYKEIASALGTTPKAVERLLARGRKRLKTVLGNLDDFSLS